MKAGNPTGKGAGLSWPSDFPIKFAEVRGDLIADLNYNVLHQGESYIPFPVNFCTSISPQTVKLTNLTLNYLMLDNIISALVEDPYLVGNNQSNSVSRICKWRS